MGAEKTSRIKNRDIEGRYTNYFEIGHNAFEFIIDFGQYYPGSDEAELCSRIVTTPAYARAFLDTLQQSIRQYEMRFGPIPRENIPSPEKFPKKK